MKYRSTTKNITLHQYHLDKASTRTLAKRCFNKTVITVLAFITLNDPVYTNVCSGIILPLIFKNNNVNMQSRRHATLCC